MFGTGLLLSVAREIDKAARQQLEVEQAEVMQALRALHLQIERGQISDDEFDQQEERLLARLDSIKRSLR